MKNRPGKKRDTILIALLTLYTSLLIAIGIIFGHNLDNINSKKTQNSTTSSSATRVALNDSAIDVIDLWTLSNSQRTNAGVKVLALDGRLNQSSTAKCTDMVSRNYWEHNNPDGIEPWAFIKDQGITNYRKLGENQASGQKQNCRILRLN